MMTTPKPYAMLAEFASAEAVLQAARRVREAGYRRWDVHTPWPVPGLDECLDLPDSNVGWYALAGGVAGFGLGMGMIWYMNAYDYRLLVGGKPMFSPFFAFPPSFELTILLGAFGAFLGLLRVNGLPRLHHPLLKNRRFRQATRDCFYVVVECRDPKFEPTATRELLAQAGSRHIEIVGD